MEAPVYAEKDRVIYIRTDRTGIPRLCLLMGGIRMTIFDGTNAVYLHLDDVIEWFQSEKRESKDSSYRKELQQIIDLHTRERIRLNAQMAEDQETAG